MKDKYIAEVKDWAEQKGWTPEQVEFLISRIEAVWSIAKSEGKISVLLGINEEEKEKL